MPRLCLGLAETDPAFLAEGETDVLGIFANPAAWASLAGLLAALGIELSNALWTHIVEAAGAIAGIIGILTATRSGQGGQP